MKVAKYCHYYHSNSQFHFRPYPAMLFFAEALNPFKIFCTLLSTSLKTAMSNVAYMHDGQIHKGMSYCIAFGNF